MVYVKIAFIEQRIMLSKCKKIMSWYILTVNVCTNFILKYIVKKCNLYLVMLMLKDNTIKTGNFYFNCQQIHFQKLFFTDNILVIQCVKLLMLGISLVLKICFAFIIIIIV